MNSNNILSSDVLDILFEKRNKKYGAYALRKFYPNRVKTSLLIMLGIAAMLSAFTFLPKGNGTVVIDHDSRDSISFKEVHEYKEKEKPKPRHELPAAPQKSTRKFLSRIQVVDSTQKTDSLHNISKLEIGSVTNIQISPGGPGDIFPAPGDGFSDASPAISVESEVDLATPVDDPDILPSYPGGQQALIRFLQRNLHSPEEMEEGTEVQVRVKFIVGYDGNLQGFAIIKDGGSSFNEEVIRVLKKMPKWNPGKKRGHSVPVYFTLPVKFAAD